MACSSDFSGQGSSWLTQVTVEIVFYALFVCVMGCYSRGISVSTVEILYCVLVHVEKYSAQRREGIKVLFEHFKPTLLSYDEVS